MLSAYEQSVNSSGRNISTDNYCHYFHRHLQSHDMIRRLLTVLGSVQIGILKLRQTLKIQPCQLEFFVFCFHPVWSV